MDLIGKSIDRYHILEKLGQGGMAIVYKAYDTRLEREVAIKFIRKGVFDPDMTDHILKRFDREAKSLAKLTHTNIVSIIDYGDFEGSPYLVMPYLKGGSLKDVLKGRMPYPQAAMILQPIANALAFAHNKGIIHRDIKPGNILITENGQPMLTDFGIARILEQNTSANLTATGVGLGTPEYMAPEQGLGVVVDGRADIYGLGVVFYEMITGQVPYTADTPVAVLIKKATEPMPGPRTLVPELPENIEYILIKSLAKRPEDRYQTMDEFEKKLFEVQNLSGQNNEFHEFRNNNAVRSEEKGVGEKTVDLTADDFSQSQRSLKTNIQSENEIEPEKKFTNDIIKKSSKNKWIWISLAGAIILVLAGVYLSNQIRNINLQIAKALTNDPALPVSQTQVLPAQIVPPAESDQIGGLTQLEVEKYYLNSSPVNPNDPIYLQYMLENPIDTTQYTQEGNWVICFSNFSLSNNWREAGFINMQQEIKNYSEISQFIVKDANDSNEQQAQDIESLAASEECSVLIVAPNNSSPEINAAVEFACTKLPVVTFTQPMDTNCPVSSVHPIGDYAFGITGAQYIVDRLPAGGNVLILRLVEGVTLLDQRFEAALSVFSQYPDINIIGTELASGNIDKIREIIGEFINNKVMIDAIWLDVGSNSSSVLDILNEYGLNNTFISGEDQQDFLNRIFNDKLTSVAPTYPVFQWRTAVIAAVNILRGEPVQKDWILPQPSITLENINDYYNPSMPPGHYAMCACEDLPGYPEAWLNQ